jgi:NAD(P)H-flavin reductase
MSAVGELYLPRPARVTDAVRMTEREVFLRLALDRPLGHQPGQFVMVSVLGVGEAPISISCGPRDDAVLEMVVRDAGSLTRVVTRMSPGDVLGIRGPFGSGFKLDDLHGRDVLFVCGGLGLAPLRSAIEAVLAERERFGRVIVISGCRAPDAELYRDVLRAWSERGDAEVIRLTDATLHQPWDGRVGLVTAPIAELDLDPARTVAALCGPPVMYKFVVLALAGEGVGPERIFVDLERRMRCGVGKCGHCQIGPVYCCRRGPVFRLSELAGLREAL